MNFYGDNASISCINRILELLNYPVIDRCPELGILFDRCSVRELQEIFPTLVNSIFGINTGGLGWGLRTTAKENSPHVFEILYNFFGSLGPMFRLCYRLLNDATKFEFPIDLLPHKINEILHSGQYLPFYADLINVDPLRRGITSLSLNAFDYFILNFIIYGTLPLHRMYPAALQIHNEKLKTVYFFLTAEYLCSFLPSNPDAVVMPTNICSTVKAPQPVPQQQPTRSPKYLKLIPATSHPFTSSSNQSTSGTAVRSPELARACAWRTESVLYFFVDVWFRYNVDEARELPSSEFIRVVRILVKQLHAFGNSADIDQSSMEILRKSAQPMMKACIYPFLRSLIARWPLDSSMSVVLELWLSYIQPWRYTFDRNYNVSNVEITITPKYFPFILENLPIYTQIFMQILSRFERLDFTSLRNAVMLNRLVKVFSQSNLVDILDNCEQRYLNNFPLTTSPPGKTSHNYTRMSAEWNPFYSNSVDTQICGDNANYKRMFGAELRQEVNDFLKLITIAKIYVLQEMDGINKELSAQNRGLNYLKHLFLNMFEEKSPAELKLYELQKIPDILDKALEVLSNLFDLNLPEISLEQVEPREVSYSNVDFTNSECSESFDISSISPIQMKNIIASAKPTIDPALLPIQSYECAFLVRFLHQAASKVNIMFFNEIQRLWSRNDIWGRFAKQILSPPMIAKWFDKSKGISELREEPLPARISFRILASYKTLVLITVSAILGQMLWGLPSFGLLCLIMITFLYLLILALIS